MRILTWPAGLLQDPWASDTDKSLELRRFVDRLIDDDDFVDLEGSLPEFLLQSLLNSDKVR